MPSNPEMLEGWKRAKYRAPDPGAVSPIYDRVLLINRYFLGNKILPAKFLLEIGFESDLLGNSADEKKSVFNVCFYLIFHIFESIKYYLW